MRIGKSFVGELLKVLAVSGDRFQQDRSISFMAVKRNIWKKELEVAL